MGTVIGATVLASVGALLYKHYSTQRSAATPIPATSDPGPGTTAPPRAPDAAVPEVPVTVVEVGAPAMATGPPVPLTGTTGGAAGPKLDSAESAYWRAVELGEVQLAVRVDAAPAGPPPPTGTAPAAGGVVLGVPVAPPASAGASSWVHQASQAASEHTAAAAAAGERYPTIGPSGAPPMTWGPPPAPQ